MNRKTLVEDMKARLAAYKGQKLLDFIEEYNGRVPEEYRASPPEPLPEQKGHSFLQPISFKSEVPIPLKSTYGNIAYLMKPTSPYRVDPVINSRGMKTTIPSEPHIYKCIPEKNTKGSDFFVRSLELTLSY